jgi:hypothetical protein
VTVTGGQFPRKVIRPDDTVATPYLYDGACVTKWKNKKILIQRLSPKGIVATVTPRRRLQEWTAATRSRSPCRRVPSGGQQNKIIPAAPGCWLPCDSGNFRAAESSSFTSSPASPLLMRRGGMAGREAGLDPHEVYLSHEVEGLAAFGDRACALSVHGATVMRLGGEDDVGGTGFECGH